MSKSTTDLAVAWFRKADSDFDNAQMCFSTLQCLDTACFHCQQAAEKWLKAYLIVSRIPFPLTHDLSRLVDLCATVAGEFTSLRSCASSLNPYGVVMRYDEEFWPDEATVADAPQAAQAVRILVLRHAPELCNP